MLGLERLQAQPFAGDLRRLAHPRWQSKQGLGLWLPPPNPAFKVYGLILTTHPLVPNEIVCHGNRIAVPDGTAHQRNGWALLESLFRKGEEWPNVIVVDSNGACGWRTEEQQPVELVAPSNQFHNSTICEPFFIYICNLLISDVLHWHAWPIV